MRNRQGAGLLLALLGAAALSHGQITNVNNNSSTPIPGVDHDYKKFLSETVSPANGSLSVRIQVPVPKSRGISVPFSFNYDSNGIYNLAIVGVTGAEGIWRSGSSYLNQGGWSYSIPLLTNAVLNYPSQQQSIYGPVNCLGLNDFIFTDFSGGRHSLPGMTIFDPSAPPSCPSSANAGADDFYSAQYNNGAVQVADHDGTVFTFTSINSHQASNAYVSTSTALPASIEDRNGNIVSVSDPGNGQFTFTDPSGRSVISSSGFGVPGSTYTLTVSGLAPYQVTWGSAASNFTTGFTKVSGNACGQVDAEKGSQPVVTQITLPNGQNYQFQYDPTYGLIDKITYPNGAYSRYVWAPNTRSDSTIWPGTGSSQYDCTFTYDTPAVQHRYVSFDGANEVLEEDYTYATTWQEGAWSSKTTTVTTTVSTVQSNSLQSLGSFTTTYTYSPTGAPRNFYDVQLSPNIAAQLPLEQSITYGDFGGATLRTVSKQWQDQFLVSSQTVKLDDGSTSENVYTYVNSELASEADYDYGSGSVGSLIRKTVTNYQAFSNPLIVDRPCQVITYDSSGTNRVAETDYLYDGGSAVCGVAGTPSVTSVPGIIGHDETNYSATSKAARGNATQKQDVLIQPLTNAVSTLMTNFAFDETGQVTSVTDPKGNKTSYSYLDSYKTGSGTPSGQTNTYLTTVTLPATTTAGNTYKHIETFTYQYADGQLASSTDQNSQTTSYLYVDALDRLTETDFPDGGKTTLTYLDLNTTTPSVTTSTALTGSTTLTNKATMDGAGQVTQTQLTSDPSGTVYRAERFMEIRHTTGLDGCTRLPILTAVRAMRRTGLQLMYMTL